MCILQFAAMFFLTYMIDDVRYYMMWCILLLEKCGSQQTGNNHYKKLDNIVFDCTIFMIIMSWSSAAYNNMISCDPSTTGKAKSILLQINHFQYAINFFVRIDDQWKNQVNNYLEYHTNEIYDLLIQSKSTIKLSLETIFQSLGT